MFKKKRKIRSNYVPTYRRNQNPLPKSRQFKRRLQQNNLRLQRSKRYLKLISATTVIILGTYAIFFSSYFKIANINFNDQNLSSPDFLESMEASIQNYKNQNLLFADTEEIAATISKNFPELEYAKVSKNYPNSLEIEFNKFPLVANIFNESSTIKKSYIINAAGVVAKEDLKHESLPTIKLISDEPVNTEKAIIEADKLEYILNSMEDFQNRFGDNVRVNEVIYLPIAREVHLVTARDFEVWLDIQRPYEEQFKKLKKALVKLDIYSMNLDYIDLRIAANNGDRIIYKLK